MRAAPIAWALALATAACGTSPTPPPELPPRPVPVSPVSGAQATSDKPMFTVQNAKGFDSGQATYVFHVLNQDGQKELATISVPAGSAVTQATPADVLPRGHILTWNVTATSAAGSVSSETATFRSAVVPCLSGRDPYAKSVVDWFVPACSLAENIYNDPKEVLGPPDAGGTAPDHFYGFMSLGEKGYVTVDMEGCAADQPGPDVRVFQSVSKEPVSLYASGSPNGPWELLAYRVPCGNILDGVFSHYCDFDLRDAELNEARYFKIEDGEQYPCALATTVTEGADIDAIQILHPKP